MADLNRIDRYKQLKGIIKDNREGFEKTTAAFYEIKIDKLYQLEYATFADFAYQEYGYKRGKAYRVLNEFKGEEVKKKNDVKVGNSCSKMEQKVPVSDQKPSDSEYSMSNQEPEPPEKQPTITIYKDREGRQIEGAMADFFLEQDEKIKEWDAAIKALKALILSDIECDPVWAGFNVSHFEVHIKNIKEMIKFNRPWAQCPVCSGDGGVKGGCKTCKDPTPVDKDSPKPKKGRGWLIHNQWRCIPDDEK